MSKGTEGTELNHLQRYLVEEAVEDFQEGHLTRRQALKMIAGVLGSMVAASSVLAACVPASPTTAPASPAAPAAGPAEATAAPPSTSVPAGAATAEATVAGAVTAEATAAEVAQATAIATEAVVTTTATVPASPAPTVMPGVRVGADDPAIQAQAIEFPGQGATLIGYLARPQGDSPVPPVLVCHENRGLTEHIKDVTRRVAKAGYVGLAVDLLGRSGGTDKVADPTQIPGMLSNMSQDQMVQDFQGGLTYLQSQPNVVKDRPGMVGFCFGGGVTWLVATHTPALRAAVPFYGPIPPLDQVPNIQAAVLAMYGALDERINAGIPTIEKAMKDNNKTFEKIIYPDARHAFHNDTGPNYNPKAAMDAWAKTIAWFDKYLKSS